MIAEWKPEWNTRVSDVRAKIGAEREDRPISARKIRQETSPIRKGRIRHRDVRKPDAAGERSLSYFSAPPAASWPSL